MSLSLSMLGKDFSLTFPHLSLRHIPTSDINGKLLDETDKVEKMIVCL